MTAAERRQPGNSNTKVRVFISYSRRDMAFADRIEATLKARGFETLIDREEIYAFEDWWRRLDALLRFCNSWLKSLWTPLPVRPGGHGQLVP